MKSKRSPPFWIIVLVLALPLFYVGSYFLLVLPAGLPMVMTGPGPDERVDVLAVGVHYHIAHRTAERVYWPLERIDRFVRPQAWPKIEPIRDVGR